VAPDERLHAPAVGGREDPLPRRRVEGAVQLCDRSQS
jgi:hypothetical protein